MAPWSDLQSYDGLQESRWNVTRVTYTALVAIMSLETFEYKFAVPVPRSSGENTIGGSSRSLSLAIFRCPPSTRQYRFRRASVLRSQPTHGGRKGYRMETTSHLWQLCCVAEACNDSVVEAGSNLIRLARSVTSHANANRKAQERVVRVQVGDKC